MFVGLRDLWFAKGRFLLMTTVVALVALLVVMLSGLTAGLAGENISAVQGLDATYIAFQDTGDQPSFDQSRVDTESVTLIDEQSEVSATTPLGISRTNLTVGDSPIPVVLFAADPQGFLAPHELDGTGTIVVDQSVAQTYGLQDGDTASIGSDTYHVSVAPNKSSFAHSPVVWMDLEDWQRLTQNDGYASVFALQTDGEFDHAAQIDGLVIEPLDKTFAAIGSFTAENGSLQMIRGFLLVISALVVGAFFTVWTIQRSHDIAVLKAMGASTPYLLRDALGQATIVLAAAAIAGGSVGFIVGELVSGTVPFVSNLDTTLVPLLIMVVIGLVGAGLAVRSITKVDPLSALGGST